MTETGGQRRLYGEVDPHLRTRFTAVATAAAWLVVAGGMLGLVARLLQTPVLAQWVPRLTVRPMQPATALMFTVGGVAVLCALINHRSWVRWLGRLLALSVAAAGVGVIVANLLDLDFPRWLLTTFTAPDVVGGEQPARPALNEGAVLAAGGLAILLLSGRFYVAHVIGQLLSMVAGLVGATVVVAFAYGDDSLRGFPVGYGRMAISAAILTILFCAAIVLARPSLGMTQPIISPWPGGIVLRRLLPIVLAAPPAGVAILLASTTPESQPRAFAFAAVMASGVLMVALFATAAAVSRATRGEAEAQDLADRATAAVVRDAEIVEVMLSRLSRHTSHISGVDVAVRFRPAEGWLAGDSVLTIPLGQWRLATVLIDVVGHGAHPAVAASRLADALQHSLRNGAGPAGAIAQSTWVLDEPHMMASVTVAEIDTRTGAVLYASAGSPPMIHRSGRDVVLYEPTGPVLLTDDDGSWEEGVAVLNEGDTLLVFSDGLADPTLDGAKSDEISVATVDDLLEALRRCPYADVDRIADWCLQESVGRARGVVRDDASLIILRRSKSDSESIENGGNS